MRYRKTHHTNHALETPFGEVEIEFSADMAEYGGALAHREGDHLVVVYLTYDNDGNSFGEPFHDGDGYIVGRGKYANRDHPEEELFEALGLDRYGDTNYELVADAVNDAWKAYIESVTDEVWEKFIDELGCTSDDEYRREYINKWRDELVETDAFSEGSAAYAVMQANNYISWHFDPTNGQCSHAAIHLDFDVEKATETLWREGRDNGTIGNPYVVMLDVYDHSGVSWSISGRGTQCRWDTSRGAGCWLPDDEAKLVIEERSPVYATAYIRETVLRLNLPDKKYQLIDTESGKCVEWSDDWRVLWGMAKERAEAAGDLTPTQLQIGRQQAAEELAAQAVDTYNSWSSGDIYGCVVEHFTTVSEDDGETLWESDGDHDAYWGFIGSDHAKDALASDFFEPAVKKLQNTSVALG